MRYGLAIAAVPFVRMVAITGTLAMENVDTDADVDFFIVTDPRRVWLSRSLSIALVYRGRLERVDICPNYVISSDALDQFDRSFFSAHELAQMVPIYGLDVYERLIQSNCWAATYLPNAFGSEPGVRQCHRAKGMGLSSFRSSLKRGAERALKGSLGDLWEHRESMKKISQLNTEAACAGSNGAAFSLQWCKGHIDDHSNPIQQAYTQRLARLGVALPETWEL
jgi:hypothetical protein